MRVARASGQLSLLQVPPRYPLSCNAQSRTSYGSAAQEIVAKACCLQLISINGNYECCFDAEDSEAFYEIKSVQRLAKVVIYKWRMEKEARAEAEGLGKPLYYIIFSHGVKGCRDRDGLFHAMAASKPHIYILKANHVRVRAMASPLHKIKTEKILNSDNRTGYNRAGYRDGYHLPTLATLIAGVPLETVQVSFTLYDVPFDVEIHL